MSDLEALESLVGAMRREAQRFREFPTLDGDEGAEAIDALADELEPIIQQLKDSMAAMGPTDDEARTMLRDALAEVEVLREHVKAHALHARSLSDALDLTGAEVESLRAERERYREAMWSIGRDSIDAQARRLANYVLAKDSDTPEKKCPTCGGKNPAKPYGPKAGTWSGNPCPDPFHTQPSDTPEKP